MRDDRDPTGLGEAPGAAGRPEAVDLEVEGRSPRAETTAAGGEGMAAPPHGGVETRPLHPSDLAAVLEIERDTFPVPWSERTFRKLLDRTDTVLLVAEASPDGPPVEGPVRGPEQSGGGSGEQGAAGARVLGYAVLWRAGEEVELGDLAVERSARRRGIGRRLVAEVLAVARGLGARSVFLEVRESNVAARRLYETEGFRVVGRRPRYYTRPREDALVMRRAV